MSAVLSRRIIGDVQANYASKKHWSLTARIDSLISDGRYPESLTSNLHHLREIADFGAHTQLEKRSEGEEESGDLEVVIIPVDREDAEWTLDLVDRVFDYFIVLPAKDDAMKRKWDANIAKAGRKPLRPGSSEDGT